MSRWINKSMWSCGCSGHNFWEDVCIYCNGKRPAVSELYPFWECSCEFGGKKLKNPPHKHFCEKCNSRSQMWLVSVKSVVKSGVPFFVDRFFPLETGELGPGNAYKCSSCGYITQLDNKCCDNPPPSMVAGTWYTKSGRYVWYCLCKERHGGPVLHDCHDRACPTCSVQNPYFYYENENTMASIAETILHIEKGLAKRLEGPTHLTIPQLKILDIDITKDLQEGLTREVEKDEEAIIDSVLAATGCECGSGEPYGPVHSTWCPMHEPLFPPSDKNEDLCPVCKTEMVLAGCSECLTAERDYCPKCAKCTCCGKENAL